MVYFALSSVALSHDTFLSQSPLNSVYPSTKGFREQSTSPTLYASLCGSEVPVHYSPESHRSRVLDYGKRCQKCKRAHNLKRVLIGT